MPLKSPSIEPSRIGLMAVDHPTIIIKNDSQDHASQISKPPSILRLTNFQDFGKTKKYGPIADQFQRLPNEILIRIFSYIDAEDLLVCNLVSHRWRLVASDWHLWQVKLMETMSRRWSTIVCIKQPVEPLPFREPNSVHPKEIYRFLTRYVPQCQQITRGEEIQTDTEDNLSPQTDDEEALSSLFPSTGIVSHWWNQIRSRIPFTSSSNIGFGSIATSMLTSQSPKPRFALFGPGFDHSGTNRLFRKMVNTRTKSFEPIDMFTGHMGFGSGITMRLFAQAQQAAMDSSICPKLSTPITQISDCQPPRRRRHNCLPLSSKNIRPVSTSLPSAAGSTNPATPLCVHHTDFSWQQCSTNHEDFTFDLSYLYSLPTHLKSVINDQYSRLTVSRLFSHTSSTQISEHEPFTELKVTEEMQSLCRSLDGLIYAMDARESVEQLAHLYFELRAVLRGFPRDLSDHIPIVILYIMPSENIKLSEEAHSRRNAKMLLQGSKLMVNRDSYSGAEYTAAWSDSLLHPISALRLFQLANPWRLQKCSSNDLKTLIQSIMWLNSRHAATVATKL